MWIAKRIYLQDKLLDNRQKQVLMDVELRLRVYPFIDFLSEKKLLIGWYSSKKAESEGDQIINSSVRIYLEIIEEQERSVELEIEKFELKHKNKILFIQDEPVDENKKNLEYIKEASGIAKRIVEKYTNWTRIQNKECFDEVNNEVDELKKRMEGFSEEEKDEAAHFILQNTGFPEESYGSSMKWNKIQSKFATLI